MDKKISFGQYRTIDLGIMAGLLVISQVIFTQGAKNWFWAVDYIVSPMAIVTALVMMRWGSWAAIHAALGGLVFSFSSGGSWQHYVIYGVGNLLCMVCLLYFKTIGKEKLRQNAFWAVAFAVSVQLAMLLGRAGVAFVLGHSLAQCWAFITTDLLSALFTGVLAWIARRVDGLFEDQKYYLLRIQEEKQ